jgi:hypothetical protein
MARSESGRRRLHQFCQTPEKKSRDISRHIWNVLRLFIIFVYLFHGFWLTTNNVLRTPDWETLLLRNNLEPTARSRIYPMGHSAGITIDRLLWNPPLVTLIDSPHPASLKFHFVNLGKQLWALSSCRISHFLSSCASHVLGLLIRLP